MATSKTLKPTNVTISIPAMTDRPNQSVNSNCIDKLADAVNKTHDKFPTSQCNTLSDMISYFQNVGVGMINVSTTVGNTLYEKNRQGLVIGFKIGNDYVIFIAVDSGGDSYSGYVTVANRSVTYHALQ